GATYFGTNQPPGSGAPACTTNLGTARGYKVNLITGSTQSQIFDGGGLLPTATKAVVTVNVNGVDQNMPVIIGGGDPGGGGPDSRAGGGVRRLPIPLAPPRKRTYWFLEKQDK